MTNLQFIKIPPPTRMMKISVVQSKPQSKLYADLNVKPDKKFTVREARTLDNITLTDGKLTSPHQVPSYIIETLMIVNYQAREFKVTDKDENKHNCDSDSDESQNDVIGINPMDGMFLLFYRSDILLRRVLAIKLSACQLSVQFLLPAFHKRHNVAFSFAKHYKVLERYI